MLDTETKRRIDTARDILVGKVPDPKSQVEQITIALIYKFMDDMDKESIGWGGKASYFTGDFQKYSWSNLMNPKIGGAERYSLFEEGLKKLPLHPDLHFPDFFRKIFEGAKVPYSNIETLNLFLKTINEFNYDHSERLGDAFEYLLSVLSSQGDAGQFRTPRHIIDFIVAALEPKKNESILDPACGTAGFLISAYNYIRLNLAPSDFFDYMISRTKSNGNSESSISSNHNNHTNHTNHSSDNLTPQEKKKLINNFSGYDISPDMVRLSLVNMYLHNFTNPKIYEYDTLTSEDRWGEYFDVIMANPPFMSPKGGIKPHKKFTMQANRSEVLFVDYIAEHIMPGNGRAGVIVPEGIIFQSANAYKSLRKMLVDNDYLYAVVSLPAGIFQPYSGVKTSILLLDRAIAKKSDNILFIKVENDGFSLGAQRKEIEKNDLTAALQLITNYKLRITKGESITIDDDNVIRNSQFVIVSKADIAKNGDYNLSIDRYGKVDDLRKMKYEMVDFEELIEDVKYSNKILKSDFLDNGKYPIIDQSENYIAGYWNNEKDVFKITKPIIIFGDHTRIFKYIDVDFVLGADGVKILQPKDIIEPKFFYFCLKNLIIKNLGYSRHYKELKEAKIPLPPLSIQQEIVAKIENYQKIIDGAKQIVANYKPQIDIEPDWEMVELGEVCEVNPKKSEIKDLDANTMVSFVPMSDLSDDGYYFQTKEEKIFSEVYGGYTYFKNEDVLLAKVTPCFENGKAGIAKNLINGIGFGSSEYYVFRSNHKILPIWIFLNVTTPTFKKLGKDSMTGTGGLQRVPKDFVQTFKIPLPPLEIQQEIVSRIENEQKLVDANKELIKIFEQKIKDEINKLWV
ncbi:MAG: putative type restriction enzymeP protein [Ignavibacteria bacterium]|nr:putative type restriction enzymeP protein [Ignavibacteria bacterium]